MIEVHPGLFVGNNEDFIGLVGDAIVSYEGSPAGWAIVHACKEPYHREFVGYTAKGAPKDHPEYLFARRGDRLALNLVDVAYPEYVRPELVNEAMTFIRDAHTAGRKVLIHCNQGGSRAPGLALHWLRHSQTGFNRIVAKGNPGGDLTFEEGEALFRTRYPLYKPAEGIRGFVREHWED